jgi:hypothetical protein
LSCTEPGWTRLGAPARFVRREEAVFVAAPPEIGW